MADPNRSWKPSFRGGPGGFRNPAYNPYHIPARGRFSGPHRNRTLIVNNNSKPAEDTNEQTETQAGSGYVPSNPPTPVYSYVKPGYNPKTPTFAPTPTPNGVHEIDVNNISFRLTEGGSKLVRITAPSDDLPTPNEVTIGGIQFLKSASGNLYRIDRIQAKRSAPLILLPSG
ncbi:hypothetical protein EJ06DRAFT_302603 [Trichodelitschia bisporula]|uniref:Uncharacterized protein n=1 Tax=Trichodelitschia bisporula TaxID=703511 RepID=A0A6G1I7A8_9PEZI|nr:hypothetical protein EJ06DRAFT_302603 [Trichodelitschia bisporula]